MILAFGAGAMVSQSGDETRSAEWGQAIVFFLAPLIFILLLEARFMILTEDDGWIPPDGGMLTPVYRIISGAKIY